SRVTFSARNNKPGGCPRFRVSCRADSPYSPSDICPSGRSMIRAANLNDLDTLVRIENRCFDTDRISRRNFRYLLTKANAATLADEQDGGIRGYSMVPFHTGTSLARLYSYA